MPTPAANAMIFNGPVSDFTISADGLKTYVAGSDGAVRSYNTETGELLGNWAVGHNLGGIAISPDGSFIMAVE